MNRTRHLPMQMPKVGLEREGGPSAQYTGMARAMQRRTRPSALRACPEGCKVPVPVRSCQ